MFDGHCDEELHLRPPPLVRSPSDYTMRVTVSFTRTEFALIDEMCGELHPAVYVREAALDAAASGRRLVETHAVAS